MKKQVEDAEKLVDKIVHEVPSTFSLVIASLVSNTVINTTNALISSILLHCFSKMI